jgi:hypothetical protein
MAFDFGAALTAAGQVAPAWQQQKLDAAEEQRRALTSQIQARKAQSDIAYQQALTQRQDMERQRGIPFRTYTAPNGEVHEVLLTPNGLKDFVQSPSPADSFKTIESLLKDEGVTLTPEQKTSTLLQSYGIKQPVGAFKPLTGISGQPFKGADGSWYINGTNPEGQVIAQPLGANYQGPTPKFNMNQQWFDATQKKLSGQPLTSEDQNYLKAFDLFNKITRVAPGIERMKALAQFGRYVPVVDPDTGNVYPVSIEDAEKNRLPMTQSLPFQVAKATQTMVGKYFTTGKGGQNIVAFNTADQHLQMLSKLADALQNGDFQGTNYLSQQWAKATGDPAPTNFESLRNSLVGEMARVFTGVGATEQEIKEITGPLSLADSPAQLKGAIETARGTMQARIAAIMQQHAAALKGQPAFPSPDQGDSSQYQKGQRAQGPNGSLIEFNGTAWVPVPKGAQ